jgi:hypothetical protein
LSVPLDAVTVLVGTDFVPVKEKQHEYAVTQSEGRKPSL